MDASRIEAKLEVLRNLRNMPGYGEAADKLADEIIAEILEENKELIEYVKNVLEEALEEARTITWDFCDCDQVMDTKTTVMFKLLEEVRGKEEYQEMYNMLLIQIAEEHNINIISDKVTTERKYGDKLPEDEWLPKCKDPYILELLALQAIRNKEGVK